MKPSPVRGRKVIPLVEEDSTLIKHAHNYTLGRQDVPKDLQIVVFSEFHMLTIVSFGSTAVAISDQWPVEHSGNKHWSVAKKLRFKKYPRLL